MEWYHYLIISLIIFTIIVAIMFLFLLPFICYKRTFYAKGNKEKNFDATNLPDQDVYNLYKELILKDIFFKNFSLFAPGFLPLSFGESGAKNLLKRGLRAKVGLCGIKS